MGLNLFLGVISATAIGLNGLNTPASLLLKYVMLDSLCSAVVWFHDLLSVSQPVWNVIKSVKL